MCGITGIFNYGGQPVSAKILQKMTEILAHRGPDDQGLWNGDYIGLGHRRLAIIDPTPAGRQPMISYDQRYLIVYNGVIYNFRELKVELEGKGYVFHSKADTEVVVNAWACWGKEALLKFNGMFAFAIWDKKERKLILARDRYGIKPLYYFDDGKKLLFGSEIKAILEHPDYKTDVSYKALNEYFTFQNIFSDLTLFKGIKLLPPANHIEFKLEEGLHYKNKFWDFEFKEEHAFSSEADYIEELDRIFGQAVNRQLVSDMEIGSYLSGGMDSGGITSIAAKSSPHWKTFTAGFDLSSASGMELAFDEREKAEFLSHEYHTEHYEVVLKAGDMERVMERLIWHQEDLRVGQCYPNYYINRLASKFVPVALAGAGGDELFAGYPWRYYRTVVNKDFEDYVGKYYNYWSRLIADEEKPHFFKDFVNNEIRNHSTKEVFKSVLNHKEQFKNIKRPEDYINNSLYFEIKTFLHGLLVVEDKLSMAHGLEMRLPFLDNDLVDFAMKVPVKYKLKNLKEVVRLNENEPGPKTQKYFNKTNDGKILLRKMLQNYVPHDYANGIKQGFSAPDASWFKGESIEYVKRLLFDKRARIYDYIQPEMAQKLLNEHFSGKTNRRLLVWSLLSFEWWLRVFMK